jgi:hypothetical protein
LRTRSLPTIAAIRFLLIGRVSERTASMGRRYSGAQTTKWRSAFQPAARISDRGETRARHETPLRLVQRKVLRSYTNPPIG